MSPRLVHMNKGLEIENNGSDEIIYIKQQLFDAWESLWRLQKEAKLVRYNYTEVLVDHYKVKKNITWMNEMKIL